MNISEFFTHFVGKLNRDYEYALTGLADAQLYYLPNDRCNHIAFHAWHYIRTEDNVINFICQDRKPPVWIRQNLFEKWSLPRVDQGTGMPREQANAIRLPGLPVLIQYAHDVWTDAEPYLAGVSMEDLQGVTKFNNALLPKLQIIGQGLLAHGNQHLGQIHVLRSVQGLEGEGGK